MEDIKREKLERIEAALSESKKKSDRKVADLIGKLIYDNAYDLITPFEVQLRKEYIRDRLYALMLKKMDKVSRDAIFELECSNTDYSIQIYKATKGKWYVDSTAASKVEHRKDSFGHYSEPAYQIPRTEEGYILTDDLELTEEQTKEAQEFLDEYDFLLYVIHKNAEARNALLNGGYHLKDANQSRELVDAIIDYMGYPREAKKISNKQK